MRCHRCPHNAEIARLREICLKCKLSDVVTSETVSLDALPSGDEAERFEGLRTKIAPGFSLAYDPNKPDGEDGTQRFAAIPPDAVEYLLTVMRTIADLELSDLMIVHGLLRGWSIMRMADMYGESKTLISLRRKNALRRNPWLESVCGEMRRRRKDEWIEDMERKPASGDILGAAWIKRANMPGRFKKQH